MNTDESTPAAQTKRPVNLADAIGSGVITVVFIVAFVTALSFSALAGYFPLGVSALGAVISFVLFVRVVFFPPKLKPEGLEDAAHSQTDAEYQFFASLTTRDWLVSGVWLAGFFVGLAFVGIYVTSAAFTIAYLKFQAGKSWLFAVIYAVIATGVIWAAFGLLLKLPLPTGIVGLS